MATTLQTLVDVSRRHLIETTASFWSDAELVALLNRGVRDLWRAINDNFQNYNFTTVTTVTQASGASVLSSVPTNCSIILGIEPASRATYPNLHYRPKDYVHPDFSNARAADAFQPESGGTIWYDRVNAGAPVAAPTIEVAPSLTATLSLRLTYIPTIGAELVIGDPNPIPGESDNALIAWCVAYARAKEREDRSPDPSWIAVYGTEKQNILASLTPDQHDEEDITEALFEGYWP